MFACEATILPARICCVLIYLLAIELICPYSAYILLVSIELVCIELVKRKLFPNVETYNEDIFPELAVSEDILAVLIPRLFPNISVAIIHL
jgi:hypothetical protein